VQRGLEVVTPVDPARTDEVLHARGRERTPGGVAVHRVEELDPTGLGERRAPGRAADVGLDHEVAAAAHVALHLDVAEAPVMHRVEEHQRRREHRVVAHLLAEGARTGLGRPLSELAREEGRERPALLAVVGVARVELGLGPVDPLLRDQHRCERAEALVDREQLRGVVHLEGLLARRRLPGRGLVGRLHDRGIGEPAGCLARAGGVPDQEGARDRQADLLRQLEKAHLVDQGLDGLRVRKHHAIVGQDPLSLGREREHRVVRARVEHGRRRQRLGQQLEGLDQPRAVRRGGDPPLADPRPAREVPGVARDPDHRNLPGGQDAGRLEPRDAVEADDDGVRSRAHFCSGR
jgi:hypothetical protein